MKLCERLLRFIKRQPGNVIFRAELVKLGSPAQITAAINTLIDKRVIVRISTGIYVKTRPSSVTGAIVAAGSLETLTIEILTKMGVSFTPGQAAADYNSGHSTQLPGSFRVNTGKRRISRKITVGGRTVLYENDFRKMTY